MLAATVLVRDLRQIAAFLYGVLACTIPAALMLVLNPTLDRYSGAVTFVGSDTIGSGISCAFSGVILLYFLTRPGQQPFRQRLPSTIILTLAIAFFAYACLLTQARQAAVMLAFGFVAMTFLPGRRVSLQRIALGFFAVGAALSVVWLATTSGRLGSGIDSARVNLWSAAWTVLQDHPMGIGFGNYPLFAPSGSLSSNVYPHNLLLQSFLEGGVFFGVSMCLVIIVAYCRVRHHLRNPAVAVLVVITSMILFSSMVSSDITGLRLMAVGIGAMLGIGSVLQQGRSRPQM